MKLLQRFFFWLLLTTRTKRVSIIPLGNRRGLNYRDLFTCSLFPQSVECKILFRLIINKEGKLITATLFRDNQQAETRDRYTYAKKLYSELLSL